MLRFPGESFCRMRIFVLLLAVAGFGSAAWLLFNKFQRYRGRLAADARAREMLETWDDRAREAKRLDEWSKGDPRNRASR